MNFTFFILRIKISVAKITVKYNVSFCNNENNNEDGD